MQGRQECKTINDLWRIGRTRHRVGADAVRTFFQDIRYALRMLAKNAGFTRIAVLMLARGIGANTAIFSVLTGVLFKPLLVKAPEELVNVYSFKSGDFVDYAPMSYPDYNAFPR